MQVEHLNECILNKYMELKWFTDVNIKKLCIIAEPSENAHIPCLKHRKKNATGWVKHRSHDCQ